MTLSNAAIAACFAPETDVVYHTLVTITHPAFAQPIRACDNGADVVSNGNTYSAIAFKLTLPVVEGDSPPEVNIEIDNIDRQILGGLRQNPQAATVQIDVVLSTDPDTAEVTIPDLKLRVTEYDVLKITGSLMFDYPLSVAFLKERYTPGTTPGLFIVR